MSLKIRDGLDMTERALTSTTVSREIDFQTGEVKSEVIHKTSRHSQSLNM